MVVLYIMCSFNLKRNHLWYILSLTRGGKGMKYTELQMIKLRSFSSVYCQQTESFKGFQHQRIVFLLCETVALDSVLRA